MTLQNGLVHNATAYHWTDTLAYHPETLAPVGHTVKAFGGQNWNWAGTFAGTLQDGNVQTFEAMVLEARASEIPVQQNAAVEIGYGKPPPQTKGTARQIAEETGLSVDTVRRALNPGRNTSPAIDRRAYPGVTYALPCHVQVTAK